MGFRPILNGAQDMPFLLYPSQIQRELSRPKDHVPEPRPLWPRLYQNAVQVIVGQQEIAGVFRLVVKTDQTGPLFQPMLQGCRSSVRKYTSRTFFSKAIAYGGTIATRS